MSPDIIVRQQKADAATLTQIQDMTNGSLGENIQFGPNDHYVYFRLKNRGSAAASGTFRLFISPVSTFPAPANWTQVGTYNFPSVAAGASWVPATNNDCIIMPGTMITNLGEGHFCFIGIIENVDDPAPDRMQINTVAEFCDFIQKSNNFAWRNCDIATVTPNNLGKYDPIERKFVIRGFDPRKQFRDLEVDTRNLPMGTQLTVWVPATKVLGLKASEARALSGAYAVNKIGDALMELPIDGANVLRPATPVLAGTASPARAVAQTEPTVAAPAIRAAVRRLPVYGLVQEIPKFMIPKKIAKPQLANWQPLTVEADKVIRLHNLAIKREEQIDVHFVVQFPPNLGWRDVTLAFRERESAGTLGQMNFVFRIRPRS
jgi:hypothetical protein